MRRIQKGQVVAFFAFDIGYEIDLAQLSRLTAAVPAQPISRKKQTPPYLQYTKPPHIPERLLRCRQLPGRYRQQRLISAR